MAVDPVCGMVLDEEQAVFCTNYKGKRYCFCSDECKQEFEEDPEEFVYVEDTLDYDSGV